jgi:hypothetical protein
MRYLNDNKFLFPSKTPFSHIVVARNCNNSKKKHKVTREKSYFGSRFNKQICYMMEIFYDQIWIQYKIINTNIMFLDIIYRLVFN